MTHVLAAILGAFVGYALAVLSSDGDRKPPVNPEWVVPITRPTVEEIMAMGDAEFAAWLRRIGIKTISDLEPVDDLTSSQIRELYNRTTSISGIGGSWTYVPYADLT